MSATSRMDSAVAENEDPLERRDAADQLSPLVQAERANLTFKLEGAP